jgi:hypothetical protein
MSEARRRPLRTCSRAEGLAISRRWFVKSAALLAGGAAMTALHSRPAAAQQKVSQAAMQYQGTPNGTKECANCLQFVPGKTADANGSCKVVEGSISPHGYCIAWAAKP